MKGRKIKKGSKKEQERKQQVKIKGGVRRKE